MRLSILFKITASLLLAAVLSPASLKAAEEPKPVRPNLIFVLADDIGRDWFSCYGAEHKTPTVDALAAQGVRFETCWATPLCSPSRHAMLTGRYPFRTGWTDHHDVPLWGGPGMDPKKEITWARVLRDSGYATAICGKWQINDLRKQPTALKDHGFDEHCVWPGTETGNPPASKRYWDAFLQTNGERKTWTGQFGPDIINDYALDFIKRNKDKPFALYYPQILAHDPVTTTPLNKANPPQGKEGLYSGEVDYVDHLLGKLLKHLDELGIADRTIVVFACDNGSSTGGSFHDLKSPGYAKATLTDMGVHVPLIVRAPMLTPGGRVSQDLVDFSDLFPTFLALTGCQPPEGVPIDGRSFVKSLTGTRPEAEQRQWIYSQLEPAGRILRDQQYMIRNHGGFFDLKKDPLMKTNLMGSQEPEVVAARTRLTAALDALPQNAPPPFEPFGRGKNGRNKKGRSEKDPETKSGE